MHSDYFNTAAMKPTQVAATSEAKYKFSEFPRRDPPKRAAAQRRQDFAEVYSLYDEATVREQAARCVQCGLAFCSVGCPLGNRIPEWLGLTAEGRFLEAAAVSRATSNLPEICSRVCPQERLCEGACAVNSHGDPIPIGAIEKYIQEYAFNHGAIEAFRVKPNGRKVAVIGAGPAGISCADELAMRGYAVTVFESLPEPGGLLVYGIPSFKLEKSVVERRVALLRRRGVIFKTNVLVGHALPLRQLLDEFDAVFIGMGAQKPKDLDIPGGDLKGISQAIPFLVEKNVGLRATDTPIDPEGKRVAVLGGGDTAMDCLRTAVRCGARETLCLYRRDLANMPGSRKEYKNAIEEGAKFSFLTNPVRIEGDAAGRVAQVHCVKMALGEPDHQGRRKPSPVPGSEFAVPAEVVLVAYGFDPVPFPQDSEWAKVQVNDWGGVVVDENQMTTLPKVFSGGDQVRGANLVVNAVRDGRRAALGIHRYLHQHR